MAAILTIVAGALGFMSGLIALIFGSSLLTAFLIWFSTGICTTALGILWLLIPRALNLRTSS